MIRPYVPTDHPEIMSWWKSRHGDRAAIPADHFPDSGFVVEGKAACSLVKTNSAVAYIDLLISNPNIPLPESRAALDEVIEACVNEARKCGFKILTATTARTSVVIRASKHGFDAWHGYSQLVRKL